MTHFEYTQKHKITSCTASSMTFEGKCLNCGYMPERKPQKPTLQALIQEAKAKGLTHILRGNTRVSWVLLDDFLPVFQDHETRYTLREIKGTWYFYTVNYRHPLKHEPLIDWFKKIDSTGNFRK